MLEDISTLLYFFSTIPQVLAAMIALLGVFWVYKIGLINEILRGHLHSLIVEANKNESDENDKNTWGDPITIKRRLESLMGKNEFKKINNHLSDITNHNNFKKNTVIQNVKTDFESEYQRKFEISKSMIRPMILTAVLILVFSISILFSAQINNWNTCGKVYISLISAGFIFDIFDVTRTIIQVMR